MFPQILTSPKSGSNQSAVTEVKPIEVTSSSAKPPIGAVLGISLLLATFLFILIWAAIKFTISPSVEDLDKEDEDNEEDKIVASHASQRIPCRTCQFFNDNHYLRCAVHPSIALTREAIDCSDYRSQQSRSFRQNRDQYPGRS